MASFGAAGRINGQEGAVLAWPLQQAMTHPEAAFWLTWQIPDWGTSPANSPVKTIKTQKRLRIFICDSSIAPTPGQVKLMV